MRSGNAYTKAQIILPLAARLNALFPLVTTEFDNVGYSGVQVDFNITAITGTSITPTIQWYDEASGLWVAGIATVALTGTGRSKLIIDPRVPAGANAVLQEACKKRMRLSIAASALTTVTVSAYATFIP